MMPKQATRTTAVRRRLALTSSSIGFFMGDAQQQTDDDKIGDYRATTVADKGQGDTCQRDELQGPGENDQRLQRYNRSEPGREKSAEPRARVEGDQKTALKEQHKQAVHGERTDQAQIHAD